MMPGGLSDTKPATPEVQQIANEVERITFNIQFTDLKRFHVTRAFCFSRAIQIYWVTYLVDEGKAVDVVSLDLSKACDTTFCSILLKKPGQVKPQFESQTNANCVTFAAIEYVTQVVNGTIYFIKVKVSDGQYVHLKVFQSLPYENQGPSLVGFQTGKTRDDPLTYF